MTFLLFMCCLFFLVFLGLPIGSVLISCAVIILGVLGIWDPQIITQRFVEGSNTIIMMALPCFLFAGEIMTYGGLSRRIIALMNLVIGRVPGGLGYGAVMACLLFAGLSGSSIAGVAAIGGVAIPMMREQGYNPESSTGLVCCGAILDPIIPPSLGLILIGTMTNLSITKLLIAGIMPGIYVGIGLMIAWFFVVQHDKELYRAATVSYTRREAYLIIKDSLPALFMPVLIVGGIRFGVFTPTEAGAFAVVYATLVCAFWYRELDLKGLIHVTINTMKISSAIFFLVCGAFSMAWVLTIAGIPNQIAGILEGYMDNHVMLLLIMSAFLFLIGMVLDVTPNLLIFGPVLYPVVFKAGIEPYYFSIVFGLILCIGLVTPPVGSCLFVGCEVGRVEFSALVKKVWPFLLSQMIVLLLIILFPALTLVPLKFFMGE